MRQIEQLLVVCIAVDRIHQGVFDAEFFVDDLGDRSSLGRLTELRAPIARVVVDVSALDRALDIACGWVPDLKRHRRHSGDAECAL